MVPSYRQLIEGSVAIQPRPVSIEDLLQREPVRVGHRRTFANGSTGGWFWSPAAPAASVRRSAGSCCDSPRSGSCSWTARKPRSSFWSGNCGPWPPAQLEICVADVLDESRMRRVLMQHRPDVIFHAAAYKHVPLMEQHPQEAVRNIVTATRRFADLALEYHTDSLVMISTDKAVNPPA